MEEEIYKQKFFREKIPKEFYEFCSNPKIDPSPNNLILDLPSKNIFFPKSFDIFNPKYESNDPP